MGNADEKQLVDSLIEKLNADQDRTHPYVFDHDEAELLKEMMNSYRDVRGVLRLGKAGGKFIIFCAAVYGGWAALRAGIWPTQ